MKKVILTLILACIYPLLLKAQQKIWNETEAQKSERMAWWRNDRFGMFIHWGLYALPARHEWVKSRERMTNEEYRKYFDNFNPDLYNPHEWARNARAAGMKYAVITSKHHEGFCLFDSKFTDYKASNTPYGKDILKEWVDAFRSEGLKIGFYYSLIDWHHPDYTIDRYHPLRPDTEVEYMELNRGRDKNKYRDYIKNQVRELLTNYGKIDILWLDFSFPGEHGKGRDDWDSFNLLKMVRQLQPGIIVNDRLDLKDVEGGWDFTTPEQVKVPAWPTYQGNKIPWETCQTFSGSWGYYRDEYTWKSPEQLIELLIESVSKGGNLLLNVGPTGRGTFDARAQQSLKSMGEWMKVNNRSIYGCTQAPDKYAVPDNCLLTYNSDTHRLYVHILDYPLQNLRMPGYKGKIKYAQFLHDASEIRMSEPSSRWTDDQSGSEDIILKLPVTKPDVKIPVIEIVLNE